MKVSLRSFLWAVALVLVGSVSSHAEEVRLAPTFDPFGTEKSQATPITLVSHETCTGDVGCTDDNQCCAPGPHVGRDFFVCKDRCGGVVGGFETLYLHPYAGGGLYDTGGAAQQNFNPAWRTWVGYQSATGLGGRLRYFEYNRGATGADGTALGVQFRAFDAELTQAVDFRRWNFLASGGLRYAEANANRSTVGVAPIASGFSGFGLTTSVQAARDLNTSGSLRFVAAARWSAVFGNSNVNTGGVLTPMHDNLMNITEINIGPQYRRPLRNGAYLTLGAGLEAQYWSNALYAGPAAFSGTDAGFAGFSSSVAITR